MKNEIAKLTFLAIVLTFLFSVFFLTSSLRPASLVTILNVLLLGPPVRMLEKKGFSKNWSILIVFAGAGVILAFGITYGTTALASQWTALSDSLPIFGDQLIQKLNHAQGWLSEKFAFKLGLGITPWIRKFGTDTQTWLLTRLPFMIGDLASAMFLVPVFSFFILRDGEKMKRELFRLVPKRYAESTQHVTNKTSRALSEFLRAKAIEALLVGTLAFAGFLLIRAPYAGVFAVAVGVTNIIPYLGIALGALIPLCIVGFSEALLIHFWPILVVLILVNLVDMVVIFPIFVAKLVNLNPLTLLAAVAVGQEFYGLVGMLIAVPMASIFKILYQELVHALYET